MQCIFGDQIYNYFLDKIADKIKSVKAELTQQKKKHEEQLFAANARLEECREQHMNTESKAIRE